ncbi:hypothetical protein I316_04246 [Kwoniella heveanensis BCC8398]|uniref:Tetraspanin Tsp2 n=1 Tax=Kwoniella heveanensis BCC8398 TaxID=1296120 RepID=A0A1B9GS58_9TREE|nr:hypothetical protein I316_04246 [Kwoniella heveanensis BCC8398]
MTIDARGLRRRSPNPNSPLPDLEIPYSPALLSPYVHTPHQGRFAQRNDDGAGLGFTYGDGAVQAERQGYAVRPTIRLVTTAGAETSLDIAPPLPSRSRSNDERGDSNLTAAVAALRRHRTDPKVSTWVSGLEKEQVQARDTYLFPKDPRDRPMPPLPLNLRNTGGPPSITSSRGLSCVSRGTGESTMGSSLPATPRSSRSGRSSDASRCGSPSSSSVHSRRSFFSFRSIDSRSTRSSTSTLAVPFYPSAFYKGTTGGMSGKDVSEKLTAKFPPRREPKGRRVWTWYKMLLFLSTISVFACGVTGLSWALLILGRDLMLASLLLIFSGFIGVTGVLLNSRPILAFYNLLLWPTLLSLCLIGYTSYKRGTLQLERKLNQTWSQFLNDEERLRIQNSLRCCGYYNPFHDATYSKRCYPRTILPGCKSKWIKFERDKLHDFTVAAFSTIGVHLLNIVIAILSSNHVDETFGKGLTPAAYRLRMADVRANAFAALASTQKPH